MMDAPHELSVEGARLLAGQRPYGDLCRASDASALSYHSRYLASMPLANGSTFPFLGGMFTGTLPGPPTSPFRAPSTPGVNNMRFWPPTPPPEGYGRYSMNTSLFPLFGAPSPDSGAFLSQGLVSRLGSTTHLSPVIDHKEHSFFTHGLGLGSPLTPTSHVTSPSPFPHLIPSLERHPAYIGHMTLGSKDMEELQHEPELMKSHMDCLMKHNIPRHKSKSEAKLCCEKNADDCCKLSSPPCIPRDKSHEKNHHGKHHGRHQPTNKVQPCKIEVSHSPALKPDLLSPPIDSPRPDTSSPCKKKTALSPVPSPSAVTNHVNNNETRCSQCCATMKGVGLATKISNSGGKDGALVSRTTDFHVSKNCPVVTTMSMTNSDFMSNAVSVNHSQATMELAESKQNNQKSPRTSPVILSEGGEKLQAQSPFKPKNASEKSANSSSVAVKHVTAAVIPTAPKQNVHRESHPELNSSSVQEASKETVGCAPLVHSFAPRNQDVKKELNDSSVYSEKTSFTMAAQSSLSPAFTSNSPSMLSKPMVTNCKVKDMIRSGSTVKQMNGDKPQQQTSPFKNSELDLSKTMPNSPVKSVPSTISVSPTIMTKSPCQNAKVPPTSLDSPSPVMKAEVVSARMDCEFSQRSTSWSKATVLPYNWQNNSNQDDQAINLTVAKKPVKPEPNEALSLIVKEDSTHQSSVKFGSEGAFSNSGMIGVCHPNTTPVAVNKVKGTPAVSSISNFSSISVVNQPAEQSTEVHIMHRSSKSSFPIVNRNNATPPVPLKSTISHVTANTSIRSVKAERLTTKRGKLGEMDKLSGRATLATLAPKLSKTVGFGKDSQASHTLSASSSVSSTSIVFPATVNPCIPVGIAIAQQRQDSSSTTAGKSQSSVPSSTPGTMTPNQNLAASRVAADLQAQELLADQKNQDISCSNNPTPVDTNLLVTQGPTIVSRQWESEALTRTAMPSASWLTHGSVVAPAVWLGQGAYTAPPSNPVPSIAMNPMEPSPISLPPGGYQLARDSISGHLLLIPTANIELMDRPSVWPSFNAPAGNLPIQQLVTQQQHTQFEQVMPHTETIKTDGIETCNITSCDISAQTKTEEKVEEISGQVPSVPLATGQTYAFTTFPTQCDPSTFSYVLQSSTVMHLAHTQTASSIQTESGRRSQGTSPLHCATPSPPPNNCLVQASITEDEEESDSNESDAGEVRMCQSQSVTTAIQVDMDSQTNSEEDEEEDQKSMPEKMAETKVEMSDSANQTESVHSESPKSEPEPEPIEIDLKVPDAVEEQPEAEPEVTETIPSISVKEDIVSSAPGMEIVLSETELAPSLPVESKPVMDFIDHHGLNLLVDSIEEFASRGQEEAESVTEVSPQPSDSVDTKASCDIKEPVSEIPPEKVPEEEASNENAYPSKYQNIDTSCVDSLGLLCALAEQRFFEEALNDESKTKQEEKQESVKAEDKKTKAEDSVSKEQINSEDSFLSSSSSQGYEETSELDMRAQLAELQKKYRQKQRELELLRNKRERESSDDELESAPNSPQITKVTASSKNSTVSPLKSLSVLKEYKHSKSSTSKPWKKQKKNDNKDINGNTKVKSSSFKKHLSNKIETKEYSSEEEGCAKVPSITLVHETSAAISGDSSNSGTNLTRGTYSKKESKVENYSNESSLESGSCISKDEGNSQDQNYDKNDKSKVPVFDEQAWFVRRSERIFLSDAKVPTTTLDKSSKRTSSSIHKGSADGSQKEKKEHVKPVKLAKNSEESEIKKVKNKSLKKSKIYLSKQIISSDSNDSESSSDETSASDSENSDGASSTSENMPLSTFVEHANSKATPERQKRLSVDSACSDISSGQSEDIPLSVLMGQKDENLPELKSCILKPTELQEKARLLVLDEGLFYAGHVTKSDDPETFGILIDGDRIARPHTFSKEEILNAAVLEVKPTHQQHLPEGTRICAFWSQQYRCLYPGTVTKASSPLPDPNMLNVEFDDGDSGRIPLSDIRMLPPDFPIVSIEPNPFMILGKRRSRAQSQNSCGTNDGKTGSDTSSQGQDKDKSEVKKQKSSEKSSKKSHSEKKNKDGLKRKRSPSASNHSCSSSTTDHPDSKNQSTTTTEKDISSEEQLKKKPKNSDPVFSSKDSDPKPKKHKKHKDDHHKHHHHHHKHHHHKKHKLDKHHGDAVISSSDQQQDTFVMENSKSELMFTIKKSPSPHTHLEEAASAAADKKAAAAEASGSSSSEEDVEPQKKKSKKVKQSSQNKPAKRKERVPSVEKSKIAAFLPVRQLWRWSGKSFRRPGAKGKAKKEFFRAIQRGKESIKVGDCAVFLSTGRPHLPYIGRIETMWESWGGKMDVKVKWFYHPEETKSGKKLSQLKGALFQSPHFDENDVQTISHKCEVLSWDEYQQKKHHENKCGSLFDNNDTYFLAGTYDPILGTLILEPGVPNPPNNAQDP